MTNEILEMKSGLIEMDGGVYGFVMLGPASPDDDEAADMLERWATWAHSVIVKSKQDLGISAINSNNH